MKRQSIRLAVGLTTLVLSWVSTAAAEPGNGAIGSIGTVQAGPTATEPTTTVTVPGTDASVTVPVAVPGTGGNNATSSVGTAQAGGGNSSTGSAATAQASSVAAEPAAAATGPVASAATTAPAAITGRGNQVNNSVATAQIAGGTASNSLGTVQIGSGGTSPAASVTALGRSIDLDASIPLGERDVRLGDATLASLDLIELATFDLALAAMNLMLDLGTDDDANLAIENLRFEAERVAVQPDLALVVDDLASLELRGSVGTGPNGGNSAVDSLVTGQIGSVDISPAALLTIQPLDTTIALDGSSGIDGAGTNSVADSIGTAQVGGGNDARSSIGTVQIGGVRLAPALIAATPLADAALRGSSGIGGTGGNSAANSIGTVQVGGGNTADGSTGTAQSGPVTLAPALAVTDTPIGDGVAVGGSSGVGGTGGNEAVDSIGTVQVGGGNVADSSAGTAQVGLVSIGQTVETPFGTVGVPTTIGGDGGNTAVDSIGTVQIGGGDRSVSSLDPVPDDGPGTRVADSPSGPATTPVGGTSSSATNEPGLAGDSEDASPSRRNPQPLGTRGSSSDLPGQPLGEDQGLQRTARAGTLPFTGLSLMLAGLLGLALAGVGLGLRSHVRPC